MAPGVKRSRLGCMTCRKRKVKCDETYPSCRKCSDTGRECDGVSKNKFMFVDSTSRRAVPEQCSKPPHLGSLSGAIDILKLEADESRALDYFLRKAGPRLAGAQDSHFWTYLVPQVCHSDAATRNAVMVISYMFENPPETSQLVRRTYHIAATPQVLRWHGKSIHGYGARLKTLQGLEKTELALLSCVLLTSIEYQQNNIDNAFILLKSGYEIAGTLSPAGSKPISSAIKDLLIPILARQTVLMTAFGCPPPADWFERFQSIAPTPITAIANLNEARAGLYTCVWKSISFVYSVYQVYALDLANAPLDPKSPLQEVRTSILRELGLWHRYFLLYTGEGAKKIGAEDKLAVSTMLMYYNVAVVWVSACIDASPMVYDSYTNRFEAVVSHAKSIINEWQSLVEDEPRSSFSFEMGIVPPLFVVGCRCRHPLLRRKAVELIRKAPKQESLFTAEMNAMAVERLIQLEENANLASSISAGTWDGTLPSEADRCQDASLHYRKMEGGEYRPEICYIRGSFVDVEGKAQHFRDYLPLFDD